MHLVVGKFIVYTWQAEIILTIFSRLQPSPFTWSSHMVLSISSSQTSRSSTRTGAWPRWWGTGWSSTVSLMPTGSGAGQNFANQTEASSLRSPDSKKIINEWIKCQITLCSKKESPFFPFLNIRNISDSDLSCVIWYCRWVHMNTYCEWEWMSESRGVMQTGCNMRNIRSSAQILSW